MPPSPTRPQWAPHLAGAVLDREPKFLWTPRRLHRLMLLQLRRDLPAKLVTAHNGAISGWLALSVDRCGGDVHFGLVGGALGECREFKNVAPRLPASYVIYSIPTPPPSRPHDAGDGGGRGHAQHQPPSRRVGRHAH